MTLILPNKFLDYNLYTASNYENYINTNLIVIWIDNNETACQITLPNFANHINGIGSNIASNFSLEFRPNEKLDNQISSYYKYHNIHNNEFSFDHRIKVVKEAIKELLIVFEKNNYISQQYNLMCTLNGNFCSYTGNINDIIREL